MPYVTAAGEFIMYEEGCKEGCVVPAVDAVARDDLHELYKLLAVSRDFSRHLNHLGSTLRTSLNGHARLAINDN